MHVRSHASKDADFSQYQSFQFKFFESNAGGSEYFNKRIKETTQNEIKREMKARNYRASANPDLQISMYINITDHLQEERGGDFMPPPGTDNPEYVNNPAYYDNAFSAPDPYSRGGRITPVQISTWETGVLTIDMVDTKTNRLIWQGKTHKKFGSENLKHVDKLIAKGVPAIFKEYPYQAGLQPNLSKKKY